jgi:hypothetical protein
MADAIRYALNHWAGLVRFLADGRVETSTNMVERAMTAVAMAWLRIRLFPKPAKLAGRCAVPAWPGRRLRWSQRWKLTMTLVRCFFCVLSKDYWLKTRDKTA